MWSIDECEVSPWLLLFPMVLGLHSGFYHFFSRELANMRAADIRISFVLIQCLKHSKEPIQSPKLPQVLLGTASQRNTQGKTVCFLSLSRRYSWLSRRKSLQMNSLTIFWKKNEFGFSLFLCLFLILTILSHREKEDETGWRGREVMRIWEVLRKGKE